MNQMKKLQEALEFWFSLFKTRMGKIYKRRQAWLCSTLQSWFMFGIKLASSLRYKNILMIFSNMALLVDKFPRKGYKIRHQHSPRKFCECRQNWASFYRINCCKKMAITRKCAPKMILVVITKVENSIIDIKNWLQSSVFFHVLITHHYVNGQNTIISFECVDIWPKIYLIMYSSYENLTTNINTLQQT